MGVGGWNNILSEEYTKTGLWTSAWFSDTIEACYKALFLLKHEGKLPAMRFLKTRSF